MRLKLWEDLHILSFHTVKSFSCNHRLQQIWVSTYYNKSLCFHTVNNMLPTPPPPPPPPPPPTISSIPGPCSWTCVPLAVITPITITFADNVTVPCKGNSCMGVRLDSDFPKVFYQWQYNSLLYIYIKGDVCLSVCIFVPSFWPDLLVDFYETWHDDRFLIQLKTWAKISRKWLPQ